MSRSPSHKRHHEMQHDPRKRSTSETSRKRARDSHEKEKPSMPTIFYHDLGGLYGADAGTVANGPLSFMQGNSLLVITATNSQIENKEVEIKKRLDYAKAATYGQYVAPQDFTSYYRNLVVPTLPRIL